jgi:hypothetical protein
VTEWNEYAGWIAVAISAANLGYLIFNGRQRRVDKKFEDIDEAIRGKADALAHGVLVGKVDLVENRMTVVENDFKHLPDKETTHRLELSIAEMRTEMRGLSEKMKPIGAIAERIQDAVMEKVLAQ